MDPPVSLPSARGASNAATAAAEPPPDPPDPLEVPGIARRTVRRVLRGGAHRELVHVGLADRHEAGRARLGDDRRVVRRHVPLEDPGSGCGRHVGRHEDVLHGERDARQLRQALARCAARVDGRGAVGGGLVDVEEGVHVAVDGVDPVEMRSRRLDAGDLAVGEQRRQFGGGKSRQFAHHCSSPRIAVTRKRSSSASGAFWSACSVVSISPGSSSRKTFTSSTG